MAKPPDVLIVGGGVIGLTTAYFLGRAGVSVCVIDKGDFGQEASWAGAGIIPPGDSDHARTAVDRLRAVSSAMFPRLSAELHELTGIDNGYLRCGGLEFLTETGALSDVGGQLLDPKALLELESALNPDLGAARFLSEMAQVRNPRHLKALVAACKACGVDLIPGCPAFGFDSSHGQVSAIRAAAGSLRAGRFLLATGAWTDGLLDSLGVRPGIYPVRGQIVLLNAGIPLFRRILLQGPRYLVPRPDGRVLVGSTQEDVGFDKRTTAAAVADLLAFACGLVPSLATAPVERCWAGLRPASPDGLPFLGPVPGFDNLFLAAGHFRAGIQLSPGTALLLKEILLDQEPSVPIEPFRLDRTRAQKASV
jgi:glycine oxidase